MPLQQLAAEQHHQRDDDDQQNNDENRAHATVGEAHQNREGRELGELLELIPLGAGSEVGRSCVVAGSAALAISDTFVKLIAWYANEWPYARRLVELVLELLRHGLVAAAINGALGGEAGSPLPF